MPGEVSARKWAAFFGVSTDERKRIGALSRGTRQLLGLRIALHGAAPDILLLDEPWEGLDPAAARRLTADIREWGQAGTAILISSHRLHDLEDVATRFVLLEEGRCRPVLDQGQGRVSLARIAEMIARGSKGDPLPLAR